jgi:hypothetical protein
VAYFTVNDFKFGMDRRRERVAGVPGTLWLGKNVHLSRGGDVQRAKKFVPTYTLPPNTFGMGQVRGQIYVFGSAAAPTLAVGLQYQRLQAADTSAAMVEVLDVDTFDGKFYVIARYANGEVHHFYNGARVTDWDTISAAATDVNVLASYLADLIDADADVSATAVGAVLTISARVAGTAFTISKATTDFGGTSDQDITLATAQANVAAVAEVRSTSVCSILSGSSGTVQDVTVNGVSLMRAPVAWATSNTATAAAIAVQINNKTATHGYTALASGAGFTITAAPGTGSTPNEYVVSDTVTGDVVLSAPTMSGGVSEVEPVAQVVTATLSGTLQAADLYTILINGTAYSTTARAAATGTSAFVHKQRMWSPANTLWNYSKLLDATNWTDSGPASGAGFLRLSLESEGSERLIGAAPYGAQAAVFSRNAIHIWNINTDAELNEIGTPLGNTGALAARAILPYGNSDVFYLDEPGVRSLRSKEQVNEAFSSDIGNPLDTFIRAYMNTLSEAQIRRAVSVIGPEGRYWLALGQRIFVLSNFPGSKISAWSYYDAGFDISDFVRVRNKVYARAGDVIYLYGGADGETYPNDNEMIAQVSTSFMTAQMPATVKQFTGFDIACTGQWATKALVNPNDESQFVDIGVLNRTTYNIPNGRIPLPSTSSHVALDLICSKAGAATISSLTVHYDTNEAT